MSYFRLRQGDALERLREMPEASVQCCVTSPPFWGLRDYGVAGQIGLEPTPEAYIVCVEKVNRGCKGQKPMAAGNGWQDTPRGSTHSTTVGWQPTCAHAAEPMPCLVLDPFAGLATTGLAALKQGRRFVGIELNADYIRMAHERAERIYPLLAVRVPEGRGADQSSDVKPEKGDGAGRFQPAVDNAATAAATARYSGGGETTPPGLSPAR